MHLQQNFLQLFQAALDSHLYRTFPEIEYCRYLADRSFMPVTQQEDFPSLRGQQAQGLLQPLSLFSLFHAGRRIFGLQRDAILPREGLYVFLPAFVRSTPVIGPVDRQGIQPGKKAAIAPVGRQPVEGPQKHFLGEIGRILVMTGITIHQVENRLLISSYNFGIAVFSPGQDLLDNLFVCKVHPGWIDCIEFVVDELYSVLYG